MVDEQVKEDGKLDLSVREKAFLQMDVDADLIMKRMEEYGGSLPFTDKADPDLIKKEFDLSKNAFKRAIGRLLKEGKIEIAFNSEGRYGKQYKEIRIFANIPEKQVILSFTATVKE